jgi:hypothetical protein
VLVVSVLGGGTQQHLDVVEPGDDDGIFDVGPRLERAFEVPRGLAVRVNRRRLAGRLDGCTQGERAVAAGLGVGRDLRDARGLSVRACGPPALERLRHLQMERGTLAGEQILVGHLPQQRMAEDEPAIAARLDHVAGDGLPECFGRGRRSQARQLGEEGLVAAAHDREHPQRPAGVLGEPLEAQHEGVPQRLRGCAATVETGGQELLGVERVALRAREHPHQQLLAGCGAEDVGERLGEEGGERPRRAVRPVQVLDDERHRARLTQLAEQLQHGLE